jgi:hypothetical protein
MNNGSIAPSGTLGLHLTRGAHRVTPDASAGGLDSLLWPTADARAVLEHGMPHRDLPPEVNAFRTRNMRHLWRGARRIAAAKALGIPTYYGALYLSVQRGDGTVVPYGLASLRVVTTVGVGFIVDAFQNLVEAENMKFHAFGTGTAAEAAGDTALGTELTTQYNPDSTRPTGTTTEGASGNIYRTVATLTPDSGGTIAITEHGILSQAATGGGVLLDRSVFAAVNVIASSDSLTATYELTFPAGS